jgi:hypothetical protein
MSDENTFISKDGAWSTFIQVMHHWREGGYRFQYEQFQADFLGISASHYADLMLASAPELDADLLQRIDYIAKIATALSRLFHHRQIEAEWLERPRYKSPDLLAIVGEPTVADYLIKQGLEGFARIHDYLETKIARVQTNERHLLCLGVCNTLIEIPLMYSYPFVELLSLAGRKDVDPETVLRHAMDVTPSLACAIPLSPKIMLLKRPHLQAFIDFIKQQPNLDVAIMTGATKKYVDLVLGKAAPELLSLCKFVWMREDDDKFFKRTNGIDYKTLQYIPELEGYQLGKILMLEHNKVFPAESHLDIEPFMMSLQHPEWQDQDDALLTAIRRLSVLLPVDDIIALRKKEDEEDARYSDLVADYEKKQNANFFDPDYKEKMKDFPHKRPRAIDDFGTEEQTFESVKRDI